MTYQMENSLSLSLPELAMHSLYSKDIFIIV